MELGSGVAGGGTLRDPALTEVRQQYQAGDLVLFVGAGVSAAAGLPSWGKLVEALLDRAKARGAGADVLDEVTQLLAGSRYVDALTAASDAAGPGDMIAVVKAALDDRKRVNEVPEIGKAIAALAPRLRAVLTTNLDHLLERAFGGGWPALHRATGGVMQERGIILKLHGTLLDPETWVLTRSQYDRAMYNDPRLKDAVASVFRARTLLFVGYGLADDDFDMILGGLRALSGESPPRHYALVPKAEATPHWRKVREDAGVRIITYEAHAEVPAILRWLAAEEGIVALRSALAVAMQAAPAVAPPPPPAPASAPLPPPPDAPYDPRFYIHRHEEERRALAKLAVPGSPVVLWAPARFGATCMQRYLIERVEEEDAKLGDKPLILEADLGALVPGKPEELTPDSFLKSFARHLLREVGAGAAFDAIAKDPDAWSNKLRDLMEDHVLPRAPGRAVLVLDRADALWGEARVQGEFYRALRVWKDRAHKRPWSKLRLVLLISTTPALVFDDPGHPDSPFYNLTADFIELREYTPDQIVELARLHGLAWNHDVIAREILPLVGGHPYLLRTLMYRARLMGVPLSSLTGDDSLDSLFEHHLRELGRLVERDPALHEALLRVLDDPRSAIEEDQYQRLRRAGLVARTKDGIVVPYKLYESYLRRRWRTKRTRR